MMAVGICIMVFAVFVAKQKGARKSRNLSRWYFAVVIVLMWVGVELKKMIMEGACDEEKSNRRKKLEAYRGDILLLPLYYWR